MFEKKVTCPHCGVRNAISRKPQTFPRCGRCARPLFVAPHTAAPARTTAARPSLWLFFWAITFGLVAGVAWHESETLQSHFPTVTRHARANGTIIGRASVIDGDTIEIHGERIRLWGVDAPEGQQYGTSGLMI